LGKPPGGLPQRRPTPSEVTTILTQGGFVTKSAHYLELYVTNLKRNDDENNLK
jgi:hypothetical protein